jgi:hypothetical protein
MKAASAALMDECAAKLRLFSPDGLIYWSQVALEDILFRMSLQQQIQFSPCVRTSQNHARKYAGKLPIPKAI